VIHVPQTFIAGINRFIRPAHSGRVHSAVYTCTCVRMHSMHVRIEHSLIYGARAHCRAD